jgi:20S proteasome subunit beta 5
MSLSDCIDSILYDSNFGLEDCPHGGAWTFVDPAAKRPTVGAVTVGPKNKIREDALELTEDPLSSSSQVEQTWRLSTRCPVPASIPKLNNKKGTTTLGFRFQGGVVLAVDSRASSGQYIASKTVQKVLEINDYLLGTMAGGAADCQYWERVLGMECRLWELRNGSKITVAAASKILASITYAYRNYDLSMGTMIAGWDKYGPALYYVDDQGTRMKHDIFSVGSGSIYAYGVLDAGYKWDLTADEATELARRAIFHATYRDGGSGGFVSVYHIHETGQEKKWVKISREDQTKLFDRYYPNGKPQ